MKWYVTVCVQVIRLRESVRAEFLHEKKELQRAATIIVHTRNADAAIRMVQKLRESGRNCEYCAFPMLDLKIKNYWKR